MEKSAKFKYQPRKPVTRRDSMRSLRLKKQPDPSGCNGLLLKDDFLVGMQRKSRHSSQDKRLRKFAFEKECNPTKKVCRSLCGDSKTKINKSGPLKESCVTVTSGRKATIKREKDSLLYVRCNKDKNVYQAKVIDTATRDNQQQYYVHYFGWSKRYNEWITESSIVPHAMVGSSSESVSPITGAKSKLSSTSQHSQDIDEIGQSTDKKYPLSSKDPAHSPAKSSPSKISLSELVPVSVSCAKLEDSQYWRSEINKELKRQRFDTASHTLSSSTAPIDMLKNRRSSAKRFVSRSRSAPSDNAYLMKAVQTVAKSNKSSTRQAYPLPPKNRFSMHCLRRHCLTPRADVRRRIERVSSARHRRVSETNLNSRSSETVKQHTENGTLSECSSSVADVSFADSRSGFPSSELEDSRQSCGNDGRSTASAFSCSSSASRVDGVDATSQCSTDDNGGPSMNRVPNKRRKRRVGRNSPSSSLCTANDVDHMISKFTNPEAALLKYQGSTGAKHYHKYNFLQLDELKNLDAEERIKCLTDRMTLVQQLYRKLKEQLLVLDEKRRSFFEETRKKQTAA